MLVEISICWHRYLNKILELNCAHEESTASLQVLFKFILRPPFLFLSMIVPPGSRVCTRQKLYSIRHRHFPRFYREKFIAFDGEPEDETDGRDTLLFRSVIASSSTNVTISGRYWKCNSAPFYLRTSIYFSAMLCTPLAYRNIATYRLGTVFLFMFSIALFRR